MVAKMAKIKSKDFKTLTCKICSFQTFYSTALKRHESIVHKEVTGKPEKYPCELCPHEASQLTYLKTHIKEVHFQKKFSCKLCPYKFPYLSGLKSHVKQVHANIKDHKCKACDDAFSRIEKLIKHYTEVHLQIPMEE